MEVKIFEQDSTDLDECEFDNYLKIEVNGKVAFSVIEGRPDDNYLHKNFKDCYQIPTLMKMAYEAGFRKEEFKVLRR